MNGGVEVDYRDRNTFGSCVFHLHADGQLCSAADPEALERRNLGTGWLGWGDPDLQTLLGACSSAEHGAAAKSDAGLVPWSVFLGRNNANISAKHTTSDLVAAGGPVQDSVPSAKRRKMGNGGFGETSGNEGGESSSRAEGTPIPNQWGICLPPINQAERDRITNFLVQPPKDDNIRSAVRKFVKEAEAKGVDTYIWKQ